MSLNETSSLHKKAAFLKIGVFVALQPQLNFMKNSTKFLWGRYCI